MSFTAAEAGTNPASTKSSTMSQLQKKSLENDSAEPEPISNSVKPWRTLIGSFFLGLNSTGLILSYGAFQEYYSTAILSHSTASAISWIGTVQGFFLNFVGVMIGPLYDRGYFLSIVYSGSILVVFGTMMQSLCSQYWQLMLSQGITVGIGAGVIYVPSLAIVSEAFTQKRALAIGAPSAGAGIGGLIYPIVFRRLEPMVGFGWATRIIGFIFLGTFTISYVSFHGISLIGTKPRALIDRTAFREMPFMVYVLALALIGCGYFVPIFYISVDASANLGTSPDLAFYSLSIINAASIIGRFLPGLVPRLFAAMAAFPFMTAASGLVVLAWMAVHNVAGLVMFAVVYGLINGYLITVITVMVPVLSPPGAIHETIGTRIGMAWFGFGIGALIGSPIAGALSDTRTGNFTGAQAFGGATLFGGAALLIYPWMVVRRRQA